MLMSNFPAWWDSTITVYNKYTDPKTSVTTWTRTVIDNCFWKILGGKVNVGGVELDTTSITCRIPEQDNFLTPSEWLEKSEEDRPKYVTFKQSDIIVVGNCQDEIDEYTKGMRSTDLISKYKSLQGCTEIKEVAFNTMSGMLNPYYFVKGI